MGASGGIVTDDGFRTRGDKDLPSSTAFRASARWLEINDYYMQCRQVMRLPEFRLAHPGHLDERGQRLTTEVA